MNMEEKKSDALKYLRVNARDEEWGIVITTVGYQYVSPNHAYPLSKHPDNYNFKNEGKRTLNEYQLVYITRGEGYFSRESWEFLMHRMGALTDYFEAIVSRKELEDWRPWGVFLLELYLAGEHRSCVPMLVRRYKVSPQTARKYKRQFENFLKKFFADFTS